MAQLDAHPVRALVERDVRGEGHHDVRPGDAARLARMFAVRVKGGHEALRTAARDDADPRAVQQVGGHGDDLAFELGGARVHVALQHVGVRVEVEHLPEEVVVIVVARVQAARDGALVAKRVLGVCHAGDLGQDRRAVDRLGRHAPVRLRRLPVRVEITEHLRETVVNHRVSPLSARRLLLPSGRPRHVTLIVGHAAGGVYGAVLRSSTRSAFVLSSSGGRPPGGRPSCPAPRCRAAARTARAAPSWASRRPWP